MAKTLNNGQAFFSPLGMVNGLLAGADYASLADDSRELQSSALAVLKCLYLTLSSPSDKDALAASEAADIVALAAGLLEFTQAVDDRISEKKGAA